MRQERYLNQLSLSEVRGGGGGTCVCVVGESVLVVVVVVARAVMTVDPMKLALQSERSRDDDLDPARAGELSACRPAPVFVCRCCVVVFPSLYGAAPSVMNHFHRRVKFDSRP
jgi:predicted metalloprotease